MGGAGAGSSVEAERARLLAALPDASTGLLTGIVTKLLQRDENVSVVAQMIPKAPKEKEQHCVVCHEEFRPSRNGPTSCVLEHLDLSDGSSVASSDRECFCGDDDCSPSTCHNCNTVRCERKGWRKRDVCYRGPHLAFADHKALKLNFDAMADRSDDCDACEEKLQERGLTAFLSGPRIFSSR